MICENCIHNAVCKYGEARSNGFYCTGEKCKQYQSTDVVPKSEVAKIFEEIEKLMNINRCYGDSGIYYEYDLENDLSELKKKYTEELK